ncbi:2-oxo-4-hydroxy-4-carboxy-5-ureidoimidazoline decarboxylase [Halalkalibacterium halodurans]|nr:2-oxo-4-hydroxy-4-carboxy-5-ureidoimidazoline decarboxylase [Halalkalibacterium halodurans]MDY7221263.1 2-oxo-4-hydroxy-4-carboxy-5-ureidoimidazoline decarboxylase [Halalkalibacterium halodurans]MDY7240502.1 2-oxo-4-hydroxy-4-carboxy-5-ureidoimidazoline decarboxylase [Halalkalibacterium halodurans]MED4080384.1 2-oxo-4-hydroxy-4-carboxy-5-ureidoimidazoline decarboxylase [Halalkalibacterium halodurans]MED4084552.1 2-oxo-4-hydroxy-4-carboxy-5-ureidoimidazoline decarboxylase [Halalkalibacterium 
MGMAVSTKLSIDEVNMLEKEDFVTKIGPIFEHSPWVAERAWAHRPFTSAENMYECMLEKVYEADKRLQLALLRAHPDLGTRLEISETSQSEQQRAGLSQLTEEEFAVFAELNKCYVDTFRFPFIMAVRGQTKNSIKEQMRKRLVNDEEQERKTALREVAKIAKFRLADLVVMGSRS